MSKPFSVSHVAPEATDVVGATYKYASVVAEFELLFHGIGAITNLLNYLTTNQAMGHTECHLQHALYTSRRVVVSQSTRMSRSCSTLFKLDRQNPYSLAADIPVPIHNIFTKLAVGREVAARLLKCFENGDHCLQCIPTGTVCQQDNENQLKHLKT